MKSSRSTLMSVAVATLLATSLSSAWSQQTVNSGAAPVAALAPAVALDGDSIDVRAKRAQALEEAKAEAERIKLNPALAMTQNSQPKAAKVVVPRAEYYVEAIRGFDTQLEAALVINGKRVTGSKSYPTLTDGWTISSVSDHGVVITKGKDRQALAFVGPEPYMPVPADTQAFQATMAASSGAMPSGKPAMPMPVGR